MKYKTWIYALLLLALGVGVVIHQWDRDKRRINKRLSQLQEAVAKETGEGHLRTLAKSQEVVGFFTPEAELRLRPLLSQRLTRRELSTIFYQVHSSVDRLQVRIRDRRLDVDTASGTASMRFTATGTVHMGGRAETQMHEFHLQWVRRDREWYIDQAEIAQAIRPPGGNR